MNILHNLDQNRPESLSGLAEADLNKHYPELASTAHPLLAQNRIEVVQMAQALFYIVTSDCKPETFELQQELRKLSIPRPDSLLFLIGILETYELDCRQHLDSQVSA